MRTRFRQLSCILDLVASSLDISNSTRDDVLQCQTVDLHVASLPYHVMLWDASSLCIFYPEYMCFFSWMVDQVRCRWCRSEPILLGMWSKCKISRTTLASTVVSMSLHFFSLPILFRYSSFSFEAMEYILDHTSFLSSQWSTLTGLSTKSHWTTTWRSTKAGFFNDRFGKHDSVGDEVPPWGIWAKSHERLFQGKKPIATIWYRIDGKNTVMHIFQQYKRGARNVIVSSPSNYQNNLDDVSCEKQPSKLSKAQPDRLISPAELSLAC